MLYFSNFSMRILTAIFTLAFGVFSAAAAGGMFQRAVPEKRIGEPVVEDGRMLPGFPHYSASFLTGQRWALEDIKMGRLKVVSTAERTAREKIYRDILLKDYGVETLDFSRMANLVLIRQNDEIADGYNRISKIVIEQRFGWDVLGNVKARAAAEAFREEEEIKKQLDFPHSIK